jgi:short subunit dehydrogenase-like uncharacterized protein
MKVNLNNAWSGNKTSDNFTQTIIFIHFFVLTSPFLPFPFFLLLDQRSAKPPTKKSEKMLRSIHLLRTSCNIKQVVSSTCMARMSSSATSDIADITVFGATGFTGSLIAEYLTSKVHHPNLKVVLAGRNMEKLSKLKQNLAKQHGGWPGAEPELAVADTHDTLSLDELVRRSKVVLNCSGPYLVLGKPVVEACARLGTDYIDITGETPFSKHVIDHHSRQAAENGSFIVSMCGFDSIPSDLGVWQLVQRIKREFNEDTRRISTFVAMRGNLSGGTMESFMNMEKDPEIFAQLRNPFLLGSTRANIREEDKDVREALNMSSIDLPWIDKKANNTPNAWTGPFMMAEINTRVVRRSHLLFSEHGEGYGPEFGYSERMLVPKESLAIKLAAPMPPIEKRDEMRKQGRLPKPGEGPSKEERDKSSFKFYLVGESSSGKILMNTVSGGDPGYSETSKMVSEAALSLALNRSDIHAVKHHGHEGGVFTPSFTFGDVLLKRLNAAGIKFKEEATPNNVQLHLNSIMSK